MSGLWKSVETCGKPGMESCCMPLARVAWRSLSFYLAVKLFLSSNCYRAAFGWCWPVNNIATSRWWLEALVKPWLVYGFLCRFPEAWHVKLGMASLTKKCFIYSLYLTGKSTTRVDVKYNSMSYLNVVQASYVRFLECNWWCRFCMGASHTLSNSPF